MIVQLRQDQIFTELLKEVDDFNFSALQSFHEECYSSLVRFCAFTVHYYNL